VSTLIGAVSHIGALSHEADICSPATATYCVRYRIHCSASRVRHKALRLDGLSLVAARPPEKNHFLNVLPADARGRLFLYL
jgi:hypothetical protein